MASTRVALVGQRLAGDWSHLKASYTHVWWFMLLCQLEQLAVSFCVVSLTWQLHGRQAFYWKFRIPKIYDSRERMSDIDIEGEKEREIDFLFWFCHLLAMSL